MKRLMISAAVIVGIVITAANAAPLPEAKPDDVGFSPQGLARLDDFFAREILAKRVPGAVVAMGLAKQLIDQTTNANFEPGKYKDTVRERVMEQIEKKVAGQEITTEAAADSGGKILDLMEALKQSLSSAKPAAEATAEPKAKKSRKAS